MSRSREGPRRATTVRLPAATRTKRSPAKPGRAIIKAYVGTENRVPASRTPRRFPQAMRPTNARAKLDPEARQGREREVTATTPALMLTATVRT